LNTLDHIFWYGFSIFIFGKSLELINFILK